MTDLYEEMKKIVAQYAPNAEEIVSAIFDNYGGQELYFYNHSKFQKQQQLKQEIRREFDGRNEIALAKKHNITVKYLRMLLK